MESLSGLTKAQYEKFTLDHARRNFEQKDRVPTSNGVHVATEEEPYKVTQDSPVVIDAGNGYRELIIMPNAKDPANFTQIMSNGEWFLPFLSYEALEQIYRDHPEIYLP